MATESTPLIQVVSVGPPVRRYPHQVVRRFFTIACTCLLALGFVSFVFQVTLIGPHQYRHGHHSRYSKSSRHGHKLSYEELQKILLDTPSAAFAEEWSRYYTAGPHLAGANRSQAEWTKQKWESWGVKSTIETYDVYQNYPSDHSLSILEKSKEGKSWDVSYKASLTEDVLDQDPTTGLEDRIPTFHGYSASGNVTGQFVFVNYGTYADFKDLTDAGVELKGNIAIAKYGGLFRGLKVKRAQELGMIGVVMYSDPGDDGDMTEENGHEAYPDGPARNPSSVQRGSVQFISIRPGDPTTPGYPSKPGVPRTSGEDSLPSIPSLPISYADAIPILKALNGYGPKITDFNKYWNRNLGLKHKGVKYNIGPSPSGTHVNLHNEQKYVTTPQWDVIGIVNGSSPNEVVIVGNHRDAWIAGGAGDPNSGSAALNELVRSVGKALEAGWQPFRTIVFASWDGEEYGLVGSTEWVEEFLPWLTETSVAYVNVDVAATGPNFDVAAAPLVNQVVRNAASKVLSPNQTVEGQTVGDVWDGKIDTMGSGSDFTAFQDYAGVPSISFGFTGGPNSPVYHYHSNYDSFHWMNKFGDPSFAYHRTTAQLMGIMIAELSESIVIPFRASEYADSLDGYLDQVEAKLESVATSGMDKDMFTDRAVLVSNDSQVEREEFEYKLQFLRQDLAGFRSAASDLDSRAAWANKLLEDGIPWWNLLKRIRLLKTIVKANAQYKLLERAFLYKDGLDGRNWFKHVVFAPGLWTGYSGAVYPGLMESIDARDWINGIRWAHIIMYRIETATKGIE